MKKIVLSLTLFVVAAFMGSCITPESSFSVSATYLYTLRAEFDNKTVEIGVPTMEKAQFKVDSFLTDYVTVNEMGGTRYFAAGGSNPVEMQNMLIALIKKSFDSLVQKAEALDMAKVIAPCQAYYGGPARLVYEVRMMGQTKSFMSDTIVEQQRFNFAPAVDSDWVTDTDGVEYFKYSFDAHNVVTLIHSGGDEPTTYTIDPMTGVLTVAAVNAGVSVAEHTLTFTMEAGKPCFLSSANGKFYFLQQ